MGTWQVKSRSDYRAAAKAIQAKLDRISDTLQHVPVQAISDIALDCLARAVRRAPVEYGDLRGSGFVEIDDVLLASGTQEGGITLCQSIADGTQVRTVYARIGFQAKYAWVQHEHVEFNHPEGGQAKYLESVIVESEAHWKQYVKSVLIKAIKEAADG